MEKGNYWTKKYLPVFLGFSILFIVCFLPVLLAKKYPVGFIIGFLLFFVFIAAILTPLVILRFEMYDTYFKTDPEVQKALEDRKCCKLAGRVGESRCEICRKDIPQEWIIN